MDCLSPTVLLPPSVSLVCMPWHLLGSPSIQLGTLEALLRREGLACQSHSFFLEFQDFVSKRSSAGPGASAGFSIDDYGEVCSRWENAGVGDWAFAVPAIRGQGKQADDRFATFLRTRGMQRPLLAQLKRLRGLVPEFLEHCADEVLAADPAVVGFTSVYSQTWPSVALAHVLKARKPNLKIALGGASCGGPMGLAMLRAFDVIDIVARGEAEGSFATWVGELLNGSPLPALPGLAFREGGRIVDVPADHARPIEVDTLPIPSYDEYFERLAKSSLASVILAQIPFESSRGCWWGAKSHCTFCGLNGLDMKFRSKSSERVLEEVSHLSQRHGVLDFTAVDNIMDMGYFKTLIPELAERRMDISLFYETKANLTGAQVRALRDAGVTAIQPGIESLSTPILKLMKKGVSAFQNIRLLKWCAQNGIRVIWNLIYGSPGEDPAEYERMAQLIPSLAHLPAPSLSELAVYRFSPYHSQPEQYGLQLNGPLPFYELLYDLGSNELGDLAQVFEYTHADGCDPETYVAPLRKRIEQWNREASRNAGGLTYRRGPGFLIITDTRTTTSDGLARYVLGEPETRAYLACDAGATRKTIEAKLESHPGRRLTSGELDGLLGDLLEARLLYEEGGKYLGLALPNVP